MVTIVGNRSRFGSSGAIVGRGIFNIRYGRSGGSRCGSMRSGGGVTCRLLAW
jgi:hypothetical protein